MEEIFLKYVALSQNFFFTNKRNFEFEIAIILGNSRIEENFLVSPIKQPLFGFFFLDTDFWKHILLRTLLFDTHISSFQF